MSGLEVHIRDDAGGALPARVSVRSVADRLPRWPVSEHLRYDIVQTWGEERSFVCAGDAVLDVSPGEYEVIASRGAEFSEWRTTLAVTAERTAVADAVISRWIDMPSSGWYSGDMHLHRTPTDLPLLQMAEDISFGSSIGGHIDLDGLGGTDEMAAAETVVRRIDEEHVFSTNDLEVERIMGGPGATIGLGMSARGQRQAGAWEPFDDAISDMVREAGGHLDGEKVFWPSIPVLAALGKLDSVELACNHLGQTWALTDVAAAGGFAPEAGIDSPRALVDWILELYYALLGCGFRLPASGGSGAGVMPNPMGASRVYARLDGPLDHRAWLTAVRRGRTFSTNGPFIELDVAGSGPGESTSPDGRERVPVHVTASSARPLSEIGLVVNGAIVEMWSSSGRQRESVEFETEVDVVVGGWIAARAFERQDDRGAIRFAHTSPVWVDGPADREDRRRSGTVVGRWLEWTEGLMTAAERENGRPLDGARQALAQARRIIDAQVATP